MEYPLVSVAVLTLEEKDFKNPSWFLLGYLKQRQHQFIPTPLPTRSLRVALPG